MKKHQIDAQEVLLADLCYPDQIGQYGIPAAGEPYTKDKNRYLRITDISDDGLLLDVDKKGVSGEIDERYFLSEGDVVFARTGNSTGRSYLYDKKDGRLVYAGFLIKYKLDPAKVNPRYIHYFTQSAYYKAWVKNLSVGSTRGNISATTFAECPIYLPDRTRQDRLVDVLSAIDRKIALNRKRIATLEAMAKEIYDYWFVQFDFPDAHGRPYKSSGGAMVYNPDLKREIPKGWEVVRIGDVLDRHILSTNKIPAKAYGQFGAYPIIDQSEKFIAGYTDDKNAILDYPFCTVFGDHSCELKAVNFPFARGADGTQIVVSADANVPNVQLYFALRMMDFGGGYKRHFVLAKDSLIVKDAIGVAAPRFEKVEKAIFDGIKHCRFENFKLTGLRDFLLPVLMNGQVKVR